MKKIASASSIFIISGLSQVLLMIRSMNLASTYGTSFRMDAFSIANTLTISFMSIIAAVAATILIPAFSNQNKTMNEKIGIMSYIFLLCFGLIVFCIGSFLFSETITSFFFMNGDKAGAFYASSLLNIMVFSQLFKIITNILIALMNSKAKFLHPKISSLIAAICNLGYFLMPSYTLKTVAVFIVLSSIFECAYLVIICKNKLEITKFKLNFKNSVCKKLLNNTFPVIFGLVFYQLSLLINNVMAGYLNVGAISSLNYANQIFSIFQTLIITNVAMVMYPNIIKAMTISKKKAKKELLYFCNATNLFIIPFVFGFAGIGDILVKLIYGRGNFSTESVKQVFLLAAIILCGAPVSIIRDYMYKFFYGMNETKIPTRNSMVVLCFSTTFSILLLPIFAIYALVIGAFLANFISCFLIYRKLVRTFGELDEMQLFVKQHLLFITSSMIMLGIIYACRTILNQFNLNEYLLFILLSLIGIITYFGITILINKNMLNQFMGRIRN